MISEQAAEMELTKFHIQLLKNVIEVVKVNQKEVERTQDMEDLFHSGAVAFGEVIIHQIRKEIKRLKRAVSTGSEESK